MSSDKHVASLSRILAALSLVALSAAIVVGCAGKPKQEGRVRRAPGSPAEKALVGLADRYAKLDSFSERTRITKTVSSPDGEEVSTYETQLFFRRPNLMLYRMANDDTTVIACDGQRLVVYSSADGGYVEQDPPDDLPTFVRNHHAEALGLDELLLLSDSDPLEALENITIAEGESLADRPMRIIKGDLPQLAERGSAEPAAGAQSLWVGQDDGLLHKSVIEIERAGATLRIEETMEELTADPALSNDLFRYQPPDGAKDLTER